MGELSYVRRRGFTLIELMIATAVIAILAAIAYPSYQQYVDRANRSSVQQYMMLVASRQEQFLLDNREYALDSGALVALGLSPAPAEVSQNYDVSVAAVSGVAPSYLITATGKGRMVGDEDLTLDHRGVKKPADKWK